MSRTVQDDELTERVDTRQEGYMGKNLEIVSGMVRVLFRRFLGLFIE